MCVVPGQPTVCVDVLISATKMIQDPIGCCSGQITYALTIFGISLNMIDDPTWNKANLHCSDVECF